MRVLQKILIPVGALFIVGAAVLALAYGLSFGNILSFVAGGLFVAIGLWFGRLPRRWQTTVKVLLATGCLFFIVILSLIISGGTRRTANSYNEDCILVLGGGIRHGEVLPTLQSRLDECIDYLSTFKNPDIIIVVSGGLGRGEEMSEGEAMRRYLVGHGVNNAQIIVEDHARDTRQNFKYSRQLLDDHFGDAQYSVACITSDYHIYRSRLIARRNAMNTNFYPADVDWYLRPAAYCREVLSVCLAWVRK